MCVFRVKERDIEVKVDHWVMSIPSWSDATKIKKRQSSLLEKKKTSVCD